MFAQNTHDRHIGATIVGEPGLLVERITGGRSPVQLRSCARQSLHALAVDLQLVLRLPQHSVRFRHRFPQGGFAQE